MVKNILIIAIFLFPILLLSSKYKVIEGEDNIKIQFKDVVVNDTLDLPHYLKLEKDGLKYLQFLIVLDNNEVIDVNLDNSVINYSFELNDSKRNITTYSLLIPQIEILNNSIITVNLKNKIGLSYKKLLSANLFPDVINKNHLNFLLNNVKKSQNLLLNSDDKWYDYRKKYLKIITNKDAIYKIDINRIVQEFGNVNISNLHIIKDGDFYDDFHIKSNDELISNDDEFYLYGHVAKGDTTYYEHYTSQVNFFIYHDDSFPNNQLKAINPNNPTKKEYVNRKIHLEEENLYSYGEDFRIVSTKNNFNEGWVMKFLDGTVNNLKSYSYITNIFPYNNEVEIFNRFSTINLYVDSIFNSFNIVHYLNNSLADSNLFTKFYKADFKIKNNNLLTGTNEIKINSNSYVNNFGKTEASKIAIDYFNFDGKFYPIAEEGILDFYSNEQNDSYVNVLNMKSDKAISIDTINNTIEFLNANSEDLVSGGINFNSNFSTLVYNDLSLFSDKKSFLLIYRINNESKSLISSSVQEITQILNLNLQSFILLSNMDEISNLSDVLNNKGINVTSNKFIAGSLGSNKIYQNLTVASNNYISSVIWDNALAKSFKVNIKSGESFSVVSDNNSILSPNYENVTFGDLRNKNNKSDLLIVTHKSLSSGVQEYLNYRNSTHKDLIFKVVYIEDIYNEFSFGNEGPHGLKSFLEYAYHNWESPKFSYLYLMGETSWDSDMKGSKSIVKSLVPTFGLPVSDVWYSDLDSTNKSKEDIFTSRLPANNNEEVIIYLEKLKEFEKNTAAPWFKNTLQVIGGFEQEKASLLTYTDAAFGPFYNSNLGIDTNHVISVYKNDKINNVLSSEIRKNINNGVLWTNFVGHGAVTVFDFDGWAENQLNNFGKTGILSTISCNTLAFGESETPLSRNEAYIMYPKTGFIFTYGGTTLGTVGVQNYILSEMLKSISDENLNLRNVMEIKNYGTKSIEGFDVQFLTFNNLGDPLVEIPLSKKIELYSLSDDIIITNNSSFISIDDSIVSLSAKVYNNGICTDSTIEVQVILTYGDSTEVYDLMLDKICSLTNFNLDIKVYSYLGTHNIKLIIDPNNKYDEIDKENNIVNIAFNVFDRNIVPIEPKNNWDISNINPKFMFYDPDFSTDRNYVFTLKYNNISIESKKDELKFEDNFFISWLPKIELEKGIDIELYYEIKNEENTLKNQKLDLHTREIENNITYSKFRLSELKQNNLLFKDNELTIKEDTLNFSVKVNNGHIRVEEREHKIDLQVGDDKYLALNVAQTGIYTVRMSKYKKYEPKVNYYETWGADNYPNLNKKDALELVSMLKDSVTNDDYLFFAIIGPGLNAFKYICQVDESCYLDSLKELLKFKYNAKYTDTLKYDPYSPEESLVGYTLFSSPDFDSTQIVEMVGVFEDNIYTKPNIDGELVLYNLSGSIELPTIKNIKELYSIKIDGEYVNSSNSLEVYDNNGLIEVVEDFDFNSDYELSKYNNQNLSFRFNITRTNKKGNPIIKDVFLSYKDFPELGIVNNERKYDTLMRGEKYSNEYSIKNYSFRNDIFNIDYSYRNNNQLIFNKAIDTLYKSSEINFKEDIITNNLSSDNQFIYNLNNIEKSKEVISSNNQFQKFLNIFEDTIPPVLKVYSNNQLVYDQMFISESPTFTVEMYDNSKLPINELAKFSRVKLNRFIDDKDIIFRNDFSFEKDGNLKATIEFTSDYLEFGDYNTNFLTIVAEDASGNADTASYYLNLSRLISIKNFIPYPNPFFDEIYLEFEYKGSIEPVEGEIMVFDLSGRLINTLQMKNIQVGKNTILWDAKSENGNETALGNYLVLIKLNNGVNVKESTIIQKK